MRNNDYSRCDIRFQRDINTLLLKVTTELTQLNNESKSLRGGTLYTKKYKSNNIFTEYYKGKERSIGKNKDRIHMLARRKYVNSLIKSMTSYHKSLKCLAKDIKESNSIDNINKLQGQHYKVRCQSISGPQILKPHTGAPHLLL